MWPLNVTHDVVSGCCPCITAMHAHLQLAIIACYQLLNSVYGLVLQALVLGPCPLSAMVVLLVVSPCVLSCWPCSRGLRRQLLLSATQEQPRAGLSSQAALRSTTALVGFGLVGQT